MFYPALNRQDFFYIKFIKITCILSFYVLQYKQVKR
nr:MAG TPA: hypothetical protein [Caudoviricetes sp.]